MIIDRLTNAGSLPVLEALAQFAARRHSVIAHNIANISTPKFQQADVSTDAFQAQLGDAVDERRRRTGGMHGDVRLRDTREVQQHVSRGGVSTLRVTPGTPSGNILYHDRNNRDLERLMQSLSENAAAFRAATELFRTEIGTLRSAITLGA